MASEEIGASVSHRDTTKEGKRVLCFIAP